MVISFDSENLRTRTYNPGYCFRLRRDDINETRVITDMYGGATVENGEEFIRQLYDGSVEVITRTPDGLLWAGIELSDGAYGCPEYLLESVK